MRGGLFMGDYSGEKLLDLFADVAPHLHEITVAEFGITIIRDGIYSLYIPAKDLDLKTKIGEPQLPGTAGKQATDTGCRVVRMISRDKSPYGIPSVVCAFPVKDGW